MDLTLSTKRPGLTINIDEADFATREELYTFACQSQSTRGSAALVAEFARQQHIVYGPVRITRHRLASAQSGFQLGTNAWAELVEKGWSRAEIDQAGIAIVIALGKKLHPSSEAVAEKEGFIEPSGAPGTSGPTP